MTRFFFLSFFAGNLSYMLRHESETRNYSEIKENIV